MKKYIFIKNTQITRGRIISKYVKGDLIDLSNKEANTFISMGIITKYVGTVAQIKKELDALNVEYPKTALKGDLQKLLEKNTKNDTR